MCVETIYPAVCDSSLDATNRQTSRALCPPDPLLPLRSEAPPTLGRRIGTARAGAVPGQPKWRRGIG
jgi:hypothetical protein